MYLRAADSVAAVVGMVADGMTQDEILEAYLDLEAEDVPEALRCRRTSPRTTAAVHRLPTERRTSRLGRSQPGISRGFEVMRWEPAAATRPGRGGHGAARRRESGSSDEAPDDLRITSAAAPCLHLLLLSKRLFCASTS